MHATRRQLWLLASAFLLPLTGCDRKNETAAPPAPAPSFHAADISGRDFARKLELPDLDGTPRTLADWKGKVIVVFFGYTQCPDVCPTTLAEMMQVRKALGPDGDRLESIFVTVDPERDTPEILKAYIANFGPGITALRGSPAQIASAAEEFKVFYAKEPGRTPQTYTVAHTAASFVFDTHGRARLYVPFGGGVEPLLADLRQLLAAA